MYKAFLKETYYKYKEDDVHLMMDLKAAEAKYGELWSMRQLSQELIVENKIKHKVVIYNLLDHNLIGDFIVVNGVDFKHGLAGGNRRSEFFRSEKIEELLDLIRDLDKKHDELENNEGYMVDDSVARHFGTPLKELRKEFDRGDWDDCEKVLSFKSTGGCCYFLKKEDVLERKYLPPSLAAEKLGVSKDTLFRYSKTGELPFKKPRKKELYDMEVAFSKLHGIQKNFKEKKVPTKRLSPNELLSEDVKNDLKSYFDFRKVVEEFKTFDGSVFPKLRKKTVDSQRKTLSSFFFKLTCCKCDIEWENGKRLTDLSEGDLKKYDPSKLDLNSLDISEDELLRCLDGLADSTKVDVGFCLKAFLSWKLRKIDQEVDEADLMQLGVIWKLQKRLKYLFELIPSKYKQNYIIEKAFLTREEVLEVYRLLKKHPLLRKSTRKKYSVMWMFGCFLGIRPEEMIEVEIHDFVLDKNGLIATDENGYGQFRLPDEKSKGGYSPSHPTMGHLVVPNLVNLLNKYLNYLYEQQGFVGNGYLFRWRDRIPDAKHENVPGFIQKYSKDMLFLKESDRELMELKTSRRSMNNIMVKHTYIREKNARNWVGRAAEVHMRHDIFKKPNKTNDIYTQEIPKNYYFKIVDESLNFPWNLDSLKVWERNKGYRESLFGHEVEDQEVFEEYQVKEEQKTQQEENKVKVTKKQLNKIKERYDYLKKGQPRGMDFEDWLKEKSELKDKLNNLERMTV